MSKREGIMLAGPLDETKLAQWPRPYIVQPKLDGERCRVVFGPDGPSLLTSHGREVRDMVPHLAEALAASPLAALGEIDGELYTHGLSFQAVQSIVGRSKNLHPEHHKIHFHIFDIVSLHRQDARLQKLAQAGCDLPQGLHLVPWREAQSLDDVALMADDWLADGYEGVILRRSDRPYERKRASGLMKFKPGREDEYQVIGAVEERDKNGQPKGRLGALLAKGDDGAEFAVGTGFTAFQREELWAKRGCLAGRTVRIRFQELTSGRGVPRFPVFAALI
ncbi:MAG: hypothetical protein LBV79_09840 [Candidatus Adiutrix sp.]|jgi:DNA ligase-1|nr:hypothetical protein [Candidatus Adiutrix sp.]